MRFGLSVPNFGGYADARRTAELASAFAAADVTWIVAAVTDDLEAAIRRGPPA